MGKLLTAALVKKYQPPTTDIYELAKRRANRALDQIPHFLSLPHGQQVDWEDFGFFKDDDDAAQMALEILQKEFKDENIRFVCNETAQTYGEINDRGRWWRVNMKDLRAAAEKARKARAEDFLRMMQSR